MDKAVQTITALGVPGLVLLVAIYASGYSGAVAITTALAAIGPGGMLGGVACLLIGGLIIGWISDFGFEAIFSAVLKMLLEDGQTPESLMRQVDGYWISRSLKLKLRDNIRKFSCEMIVMQ